jgi:transposase-like protein
MPKRKNDDAPYWRTLRKCETDMINFALEQAGSIRKAARSLGVSESFLIVRVKKLGCKRPTPPGTQTKDDWKTRAKSAEAQVRQKKQEAAAKKKSATKKSAKKPAKKTNSKGKPGDTSPNNVVPLKPNGDGAA